MDKIWAKRQEIQEIGAMCNVSGGDVVAKGMDAAFVNDCHPETNTERWKIVFAIIYIALRLALLGQGEPINNLNHRVGPIFTFICVTFVYIYIYIYTYMCVFHLFHGWCYVLELSLFHIFSYSIHIVGISFI